MFKKTLGVVLGLGLFVGGALTASAAANLTFLTVDGGTNATVTEGSTVEAKATFDITTSTDVESISWELVGSGLPKTCVDVADRIADGTFTASFDVDTKGASEGTWDVRISTYGDDGADVSNLCENTDLSDTQLFTDRITVTDTVDDNQTGSHSSDGVPAWFKAFLDKFFPTTGSNPTPSTSAVCVAYNQANMGTMPNSYSPSNVKLQGFLLSQGASIPALEQGAAFGFYGNQTTAAVGWFNSLNHCN